MKRDKTDPSLLRRRRVLQGLGGVVAGATLGCGTSSEETTSGSGSSTSGAGGSGGAGGGSGGMGGGTGNSTGVGGGGGAGGGVVGSCTGDGGLSPEELLAGIDTFVVLCMENRSFDHYLGSLALLEGHPSDGLTGAESNPDPDGIPVPVFKLDDFTPADPPHGWAAAHEQWNMGLNDGFVKAHAGADQDQVMGYHVREQLPSTYGLADAYSICDRYFASVMGPTWPNRFYLHGATSNGTQGNSPIFSGYTSIFDLLDDAGISNQNYFHDLAWASGGYLKTTGNSPIENFFDAAMSGTLPQFSILDPQFFGAGANDDHPDHDITLGQALIATVYAAIAQSPQWSKCLFLITYDEHGGFFDHVPPPTTVDAEPGFEQLGFRVPSMLAGPFVRRGCTISTPLEHVSVARTLSRRFGLPSLNARVDATNDLSSAIDPAYLRDPQAPVMLPPLPISMSALRERERRAALRPRDHHPELLEAATRGLIPRHLDRRSEGPAIMRRVLEHGARLGALRIRG